VEYLSQLFAPIVDLFSRELFTISGNTLTLATILLLIAAIILSFVLGRWARRLTRSMILSRAAHNEGLAYSLGVIAQYFVTGLGVLLALDNVGISLTALAAFGAILTVGIGFGLQNIAQNFISGIILLLERPVQIGDFVIIGDTVGTVHSISMRATRVVSRDNVSIIVPNSKLISEAVVNQSASHSGYRVRVMVGVAYGSDTDLVRTTLLDVASSHPNVQKKPAPHVFFRSFGDSSLDFELAVWLKDPGPEPTISSDLRFAIDAAFKKNRIEIPFPQRDIHVRSGLEGFKSNGSDDPIAGRVKD